MIKDRTQAGKLLAEKLVEVLQGRKPTLLGIPRGGVVVGNEIAKRLDCVLDIAIAKKITPPDYPEFAVGAITVDGTIYLDNNWKYLSSDPNFENEINKKKIEVKRRLEKYRGNLNYKFNNKPVILVDDGIATGSTVFALLNWLLEKKAKEIILAVPVIPVGTYEKMKKMVNSIITLEIPTEFFALSRFYENFSQVTDNEVIDILHKFKKQFIN